MKVSYEGIGAWSAKMCIRDRNCIVSKKRFALKAERFLLIWDVRGHRRAAGRGMFTMAKKRSAYGRALFLCGFDEISYAL